MQGAALGAIVGAVLWTLMWTVDGNAIVDSFGFGAVVFVPNEIPSDLLDSKCDGGTRATTGLGTNDRRVSNCFFIISFCSRLKVASLRMKSDRVCC